MAKTPHNTTEPNIRDVQRAATYDLLLQKLDGHLDGYKPVLTLSLDNTAPTETAYDAKRQVLALFRDAVAHLKCGGINGAGGMIVNALTKASLRSSAFAAALGVRPPVYEPVPFAVDYRTGYEEAVFFMRALVDAAEQDFPVSQKAILNKINTADPAEAFDDNLLFGGDRDLQRIYHELKRGKTPPLRTTHEKSLSFRTQMIATFHHLTEKYPETCREIYNDIHGLNPPPPPKTAPHMSL